ncbi:hypothetical protein OWV82_016766 [Melia azedarach]|uniref:Uncharacterized protein n=1 Tax=Melia azedarach TaxID=155640 RepID=A0ACC1XHE2_MELAZ|nr:hypothetical protein OWV82_016766 [Melia azedarach]
MAAQHSNEEGHQSIDGVDNDTNRGPPSPRNSQFPLKNSELHTFAGSKYGDLLIVRRRDVVPTESGWSFDRNKPPSDADVLNQVNHMGIGNGVTGNGSIPVGNNPSQSRSTTADDSVKISCCFPWGRK